MVKTRLKTKNRFLPIGKILEPFFFSDFEVLNAKIEASVLFICETPKVVYYQKKSSNF